MPRDLSVGHPPDTSKLRCPRCRSLLDVLDSPSGGRTVRVAFLGASVAATAASLELFFPPDHATDVRCPACSLEFDPSVHLHTRPLDPVTQSD